MSESKKPVNQKSVEQVEQERLTRRAALRKLGFGAGLSAFMLLGVDDLARMVGTKMAQTVRDNKTAEQIAKEFQSAGVAMASASSSGSACQDCWNHFICVLIAANCAIPHSCDNGTLCQKNAYADFRACTNAHCSGSDYPNESTPVVCNPCPPTSYA